MKKVFLLGACLVALASAPAKAQTGGKEVVVVRVIDDFGRSKIIIARPEGKTEEVDFNGGASASSLKQGAITLQRVISGLSQEGYVLKSTFSGSGSNGATLVFIKE
jgi:hypothetical protein